MKSYCGGEVASGKGRYGVAGREMEDDSQSERNKYSSNRKKDFQRNKGDRFQVEAPRESEIKGLAVMEKC